jgi:hypothetical protein
MKKNKSRTYSTYQEYLDFCLPRANSNETSRYEDANVFGNELAVESIKMVKNVLSKKKTKY